VSIGKIIDARGAQPEDVAEEVARVVFAGGTVIFPTDTSYSIFCDPYRMDAIDRVYAAKGRPDQRPLTLHVASPAEFLEYARENPLAILATKRLLPGPVILVVRKPAFISDELAAGMTTLAFRVPDEPLSRTILGRCGPLAGVSVNPHKDVVIYRGDDQVDKLPEADLLIEHGPTRYDRESSIVDLTGTQARLLREGAVSMARLSELLGPVERQTIKVRNERA